MSEVLFIAADLLLIVAGFILGWKFIRNYGNYFLGIEWIIVGTSATNFLLWSLLSGGDPSSPMYTIAYFLDAFSRSFGFTLVLILGLKMVTHHYKPKLWAEIGAFALAAVSGAYLVTLHHNGTYGVVPATFFVITNLIASIFLFYFASRLWRVGAKGWSAATVLITLVAMMITITYDFFPWPFDDANRTYFYAAALGTWAFQGIIYYFSYRALAQHIAQHEAASEPKTSVIS